MFFFNIKCKKKLGLVNNVLNNGGGGNFIEIVMDEYFVCLDLYRKLIVKDGFCFFRVVFE